MDPKERRYELVLELSGLLTRAFNVGARMAALKVEDGDVLVANDLRLLSRAARSEVERLQGGFARTEGQA